MLLKDLRQNLWAVGLALLFPLFAFLAGFFRIGWGSASPAWVSEGFFLGNSVLVIPLIAFMTGNVLFRSENWALILTFPVRRSSVLLRKHLSGLLLVGAAWGASALAAAAGSHDAVPRGIPPAIYLSLLAVLYLLGVWVALATDAFPRGLILLAALLAVVSLAAHALGFRDLLGWAFLLVGPGILATLGLWFLVGLAAATTLLFVNHRLSAPLRNALLASGLLLAAGIASVAGATIMAHRGLHVTDLDRFTAYRARLAGPGRLLVEGGNRMFAGDAFRSGPLFREAPAVLLVGEDGAYRQIFSGAATDAFGASGDGLRLALTTHDPQTGEWRLSVFAREGRELKRVRLEGRAEIRWRPGTHDLWVLDSCSLFRVNADDGRLTVIPLPAVPACGIWLHAFGLLPEGVWYCRIFGDDAVEVFRMAGMEGRWTRVLTEGEPGAGPYGQPFAQGEAVTRCGAGTFRLWTRESLLFVNLSGPAVQVRREPLDPAQHGFHQGIAIASTTGALVSLPGRRSLVMKPWNGDEPVWRIDLPFDVQDACAWGDQALVFGWSPVEAGDRRGQTLLFRLDLGSGRLTRIKAGNGGVIRTDLRWGGMLCDVDGPRALFQVFGAPETRWAWYRADLQAGTVEPALAKEVGK
ncbi:MAG: hypothetical protein KA419_03255 [Acidobacteria bacterium]|nr:hypothetical protein [Acidobacteriota bacterium]